MTRSGHSRDRRRNHFFEYYKKKILPLINSFESKNPEQDASGVGAELWDAILPLIFKFLKVEPFHRLEETRGNSYTQGRSPIAVAANSPFTKVFTPRFVGEYRGHQISVCGIANKPWQGAKDSYMHDFEGLYIGVKLDGSKVIPQAISPELMDFFTNLEKATGVQPQLKFQDGFACFDIPKTQGGLNFNIAGTAPTFNEVNAIYIDFSLVLSTARKVIPT